MKRYTGVMAWGITGNCRESTRLGSITSVAMMMMIIVIIIIMMQIFPCPRLGVTQE